MSTPLRRITSRAGGPPGIRRGAFGGGGGLAFGLAGRFRGTIARCSTTGGFGGRLLPPGVLGGRNALRSIARAFFSPR
jgi:hypothetical protein